MKTYIILNNSGPTSNHSVRLIELFNDCDAVLIASPFLMVSFASFFNDINIKQIKRIHLVTTLQPYTSDQIKKINSLLSLINIPEIKAKEIHCEISLNNRLHGKVYIFKKKDRYLSAIISSANFTNNGLSLNHEWGVEIFDEQAILELEKSVLNSIEIHNLSFQNILEFKDKTDAFLEENPQYKELEIGLELIKLIRLPKKLLLQPEVNIWLKPIGVTENPVEEGAFFSELTSRLHFSKRKPSSVKPDDIMITYGVGSTKILSIYKVISYPEHVKEEEIKEFDWLARWPWFVLGENITPNFGSEWWKFNLYISTLRERYLSINPNDCITAAGGNSFGTFNFGNDKLRLSRGFSKFIIDQVLEIERKL